MLLHRKSSQNPEMLLHRTILINESKTMLEEELLAQPKEIPALILLLPHQPDVVFLEKLQMIYLTRRRKLVLRNPLKKRIKQRKNSQKHQNMNILNQNFHLIGMKMIPTINKLKKQEKNLLRHLEIERNLPRNLHQHRFQGKIKNNKILIKPLQSQMH